MKRSWNWVIWAGFVLALIATGSYLPFFVQFPITRDVPWVNLLLFAAAGILLAMGLYRAFAMPDRYRGKISGPILAALSVATFGLFVFGTFYVARKIPSGDTAAKVGQRAPDFALASTDGSLVRLSDLRQKNRAVLLIFYRGYW